MPVFETPEALQAHRTVSQRTRDLEVVQDAAEHVEILLSLAALARQRVTDYTITSYGEVGEPSNGALLLQMAEALDPQTGHVTHN